MFVIILPFLPKASPLVYHCSYPNQDKVVRAQPLTNDLERYKNGCQILTILFFNMGEYLAIRNVAKVVTEAYLGWEGGTFPANLFSDLPWKGGFLKLLSVLVPMHPLSPNTGSVTHGQCDLGQGSSFLLREYSTRQLELAAHCSHTKAGPGLRPPSSICSFVQSEFADLPTRNLSPSLISRTINHTWDSYVY